MQSRNGSRSRITLPLGTAVFAGSGCLKQNGATSSVRDVGTIDACNSSKPQKSAGRWGMGRRRVDWEWKCFYALHAENVFRKGIVNTFRAFMLFQLFRSPTPPPTPPLYNL